MSTVIVIRQLDELEALLKRRGRRGIRGVILELSCPSELLRSAERRINTGLHACGCGVGAIFVLVGMVALVANHWMFRNNAAPRGIAYVFQSAGLLMALAITGKILGIAVAEWRLRGALRQVASVATESGRDS